MRIGIDLGGTKTEGILIADDGQVVRRERVPTPQDDFAGICNVITRLVARFEALAGTRCTVGLAMPGSVSPRTGVMRNSNTACLNGQPLVADLERRLGRTVRAENDANCMVVSEVVDGAAAGHATVFGVIVGTGTGGGVFANGALVRGANAIGGEWGHNRVPWDVAPGAQRPCYCGRLDCVETYLCGSGLVKTWLDADGGRRRGKVSVEDLLAAAAAGDPQACAALDTYDEQFARALAVVVNILDPDVVVLAGGLSNIPGLGGRLEHRLRAHAFSDHLGTRVVTARHGDSSGVRGAAWLWD